MTTLGVALALLATAACANQKTAPTSSPDAATPATASTASAGATGLPGAAAAGVTSDAGSALDASPALAAGGDAAVDDFTPAPPTAYSKAVLASKPIAYYRFEETDGSVFHSEIGGHKYDAMVHGAVTRVPGAIGASGGMAVHFSGTDGSIDAGKNLGTEGENTAYELWIRPAVQRGTDGHRIFTSTTGKGPFGAYYLGWQPAMKGQPANGSLMVFELLKSKTDWIDLVTPAAAPAGAWSHLVVVMNGPETSFYLNGKQTELAHGDHDDDIKRGAERFFIGSDASGKQVFEGDIDELAIYRYSMEQKVIDDATIAAHFAAAHR